MRLTRSKVLVGTGVALIVVGAWASISPLRDIVQEAEGHCDYLPCVTMTTAVILGIAGLAIAVGGFAVGMVAGGVGRRR